MNRTGRHLPTRSFAFTRTELVLVAGLLVTLALVAFPRIGSGRTSARVRTCESNVSLINRRLDMHFLQKGIYPENIKEFIKDEKLFPEGTPICPFGRDYRSGPETYRVKRHSH